MKQHLFRPKFLWALTVLIALLAPASALPAELAGVADDSIFSRPWPANGQDRSLFSHFVRLGVPSRALQKAIAAYNRHRPEIKNHLVLTIVNAGLSMRENGFWLLNLKSGSVSRFAVSHGVASDEHGYATHFSVPGDPVGSNRTSLGIYLTGEPYVGHFGYSLRVRGLSSTNQYAFERFILVHGYDVGSSYNRETCEHREKHETPSHPEWCAEDGELDQGCFGIPLGAAHSVIDQIKNGSLIYVYAD